MHDARCTILALSGRVRVAGGGVQAIAGGRSVGRGAIARPDARTTTRTRYAEASTAAYESGRGCRQRLGGGFDGGAVRGAAGRVMRGREGDRAKYGACVRMLSQWRELWRANVSGCGRTRRVGRRRGGGAGDVASGIAARPRSARRSTWSPGGPWISDGSQRAGARPGGMRI